MTLKPQQAINLRSYMVHIMYTCTYALIMDQWTLIATIDGLDRRAAAIWHAGYGLILQSDVWDLTVVLGDP